MKKHEFSCGIKGCKRAPFTRVGRNQMRLSTPNMIWENRCKKHIPKWLRDWVYAENAKALANGNLTLELAAWYRNDNYLENMPRQNRAILLAQFSRAVETQLAKERARDARTYNFQILQETRQ